MPTLAIKNQPRGLLNMPLKFTVTVDYDDENAAEELRLLAGVLVDTANKLDLDEAPTKGETVDAAESTGANISIETAATTVIKSSDLAIDPNSLDEYGYMFDPRINRPSMKQTKKSPKHWMRIKKIPDEAVLAVYQELHAKVKSMHGFEPCDPQRATLKGVLLEGEVYPPAGTATATVPQTSMDTLQEVEESNSANTVVAADSGSPFVAEATATGVAAGETDPGFHMAFMPTPPSEELPPLEYPEFYSLVQEKLVNQQVTPMLLQDVFKEHNVNEFANLQDCSPAILRTMWTELEAKCTQLQH